MLHKLTLVPVPVMMLVGGVISAIIGFGMGYLTLRLRDVFFAIATLALAIVVQTLIVNWDYVGNEAGRNISVTQPNIMNSYARCAVDFFSLTCAREIKKTQHIAAVFEFHQPQEPIS